MAISVELLFADQLLRPEPAPVRVSVTWGRRYTLWVVGMGLACCSVEFIAGLLGRTRVAADSDLSPEPGLDDAHILVVSGTCTDKLAPAVRRLYDQLPEPRYVLSFGACASSGGPYWDSYSVTKGVDQLFPVDAYVPGCPPRPEALLQGLLVLQAAIATNDVANVPAFQTQAAVLARPLVAPPTSPRRNIEQP
ncbi:MAG: NADH-quinone oxidoreductase subunit B [Actinomycetes bacterium]